MPAASSLRPLFNEKTQRVHHYRQLIARWRTVAQTAGLEIQEFARAGERPLYFLESRPSSTEALYLSAGIHGDEPAGPEALLRWAESRGAALRETPLLIFPCLNPWGLVNNQRTDEQGVDLNRVFDRGDIAPIAQLKALIRGRRFAASLCLHEDFDANGMYLYEISRRPPRDCGRALLKLAGDLLPLDSRKQIDGRPFVRGLMLRRQRLDKVPLHPEAIYLYLHCTDHALTFETPSEFGLARRVEAAMRVIDRFVFGRLNE